MKILTVAIILTTTALGQKLQADDLEWRASSPVWQVRYCLTETFAVTDATSRRLLEKLCRDPHPEVARAAFWHYENLFIDLDHELVHAAFQKSYFDLLGFNVSNRNIFESPAFWASQLRTEDPSDLQIRAIRALGLCGTRENAKQLLEYRGSDHPGMLLVLAMALHRLGDDASYLSVIDSILSPPSAKAVSHQTSAINFLIQTHPALAREQWNKLHTTITAQPDMDPYAINRHTLQERRLP